MRETAAARLLTPSLRYACSRCLATVRGLSRSSWAMALLVRPAATSRRMVVSRSVRRGGPLGTGNPAGGGRAERLAGLLSAARPDQRGDQRSPQDAEQGPVPAGEVAVGPAQGHADRLLVGAGQADSDLVLSEPDFVVGDDIAAHQPG